MMRHSSSASSLETHACQLVSAYLPAYHPNAALEFELAQRQLLVYDCCSGEQKWQEWQKLLEQQHRRVSSEHEFEPWLDQCGELGSRKGFGLVACGDRR